MARSCTASPTPRVWVLTTSSKQTAVREAGHGGHHRLPGPPARGAHERRAAPVRRGVADLEDPISNSTTWLRLQPDMFVDVELSVAMPPAITVPADAVFDSAFARRCSSIAATGTSRPGAWRPDGGSAAASKSSGA